MLNQDTTRSRFASGYVRTLYQQEELPLLRDHLLRLDPESRHDRFNGFMDDGFIERYAAKCADDGTIIVAYIEDGVVRGAAELHPPDQSPDALPEIAFSVEGVGAPAGRRHHPVQAADPEARWKGYHALRITTGAQNQAMRALANKFGAQLDVPPWRIDRHHRSEAATAVRTRQARDRDADRCDARHGAGQPRLLEGLLRMYGWGRTA